MSLSFTPKDWRQFPDTSTPWNAAAAEDLETRVTNFATLAAVYEAQNRAPVKNVVTEFGADNTGATNAATAINNAINSLPSTGGTIYLPDGLYLVTANVVLKSHVRLLGAGWNRTTIKAGPSLNLGGSNWITHTGFGSTPQHHMTLQGICFDGNATVRGPGGVGDPGSGANLEFRGVAGNPCTNIRIERCRVTNFPSIAIAFQCCDDSELVDNVIDNGTRDALHLARGCDNWKITGNYCLNTGDDQITVHGDEATSAPSSNVLIAHNRLDTVTRDSYGQIIVSGSHDVAIVGNILNNGWQAGIGVHCLQTQPSWNITITGNVIRNSGQGNTGAGDAIFINNSDLNFYTTGGHGIVDNITITGNVIENPKRRGIYISGFGSSNPVRHITVSGNVIQDTGDQGVNVNGTVQDLTLAANTIHDCTGRGINIAGTTPSDISIVDNKIRDVSKGTQGIAISLGTATNCIVNNNRVWDTQATKTMNPALHWGTGSSHLVTGNNFKGCIASFAGTQPTGTGTAAFKHGNILHDGTFDHITGAPTTP